MSKSKFQTFIFELYEECNVRDVNKKDLVAFLNSISQAFDFDGNGILDAKEIISALSVIFSGSKADKLKALFDFYDANGNALLDF